MLAFVFASLLAFLPLLMAAFAILTTLLIVLGLTYVGDISAIVQFLVALVGLGVAIDYALLLVTRWREERHHGRTNEDAVVAAMATAGHAVVLSGVTVAIGLLALVVLPEPAMRSVGIGGMLIPLVSRRDRADAAAGDARRHRPARRLAARAPRVAAEPRMDGVGALRRPPQGGSPRSSRWPCSPC